MHTSNPRTTPQPPATTTRFPPYPRPSGTPESPRVNMQLCTPASRRRAAAANDTSHPAKAKRPIHRPTRPMQEPAMSAPASRASTSPYSRSPAWVRPAAPHPRRTSQFPILLQSTALSKGRRTPSGKDILSSTQQRAHYVVPSQIDAEPRMQRCELTPHHHDRRRDIPLHLGIATGLDRKGPPGYTHDNPRQPTSPSKNTTCPFPSPCHRPSHAEPTTEPPSEFSSSRRSRGV